MNAYSCLVYRRVRFASNHSSVVRVKNRLLGCGRWRRGNGGDACKAFRSFGRKLSTITSGYRVRTCPIGRRHTAMARRVLVEVVDPLVKERKDELL